MMAGTRTVVQVYGSPHHEYACGVAAHVADDYVDAIGIFRCLSQRGFAPAQFMLGTMHASGTDLPHNSREAMKWFLLAAVQGHQRALLDLKTVAAAMRKQHPPGSRNGRERNERF